MYALEDGVLVLTEDEEDYLDDFSEDIALFWRVVYKHEQGGKK